MRNFRVRATALSVVAAAALMVAAAPSSAAELPTEPKCEFIASPGSSECMLPFPDDYYTKADPTSATGRRIDFRELAMPTNAAHQPIEVAPYNTGDGFSPGSVITLKIPGIETVADVNAMHTVPINHLGSYRSANAPVVVIDASTGQRWPIWVEIDSTVKAEKANLEIHPAVNFTSGDRYIVALRNLKNAKKEHLQAPAGFRTYRDNLPSSEEKVNERRPHFEEIFSKLQAAGIARSSLYLAWDFTVASDENNTGRELSMRNEAFATLGDNNLADGVVEGKSPTFTVTETENEPNPGEIARRVKGTFVVPCFLFPSCAPGGTMVAQRRRQADTERRLAGQLRLHHPAVGDNRARRIGTSVAVRARAVRRRVARLTPDRSAASHRATTSCSARPTRSACPNRTSRRWCRRCRTCLRSRRSQTACSRVCSTSCISGGR